MVRFIKAYQDGDDTIFELAVTAGSRRGAKARAATSLLVRRPGEIPAAEIIDVMELGDGVVKEYRVNILIKGNQNVRDVVKLNDAIEAFEDFL